MPESQTEVVVTIFDREVTVTAERMDSAATTLTLLTCLDGMSDRDREALERACRIVRDLSYSPRASS